MKKIKHSIEVSLCFTGCDLPFDDISNELQAAYTSVKTADSFRYLPRELRRDELIYSIKEDSDNLDVQLSKLFKIFTHKTETIKKICNDYSAKAVVVVCADMIGDTLPDLTVSTNSISFLNIINAELTFDIYSL